MRVGDVVEVYGWSPRWDGTIALVCGFKADFVRIRLLSTHSVEIANYYWDRSAGFYPTNLKVLGHIDVARQGEEQCDSGTS